jgi:hypothetical protein
MIYQQMNSDTKNIIYAIIGVIILVLLYYVVYPPNRSPENFRMLPGYDPWDQYGLGGDIYLGGGRYHHGRRFGWW